MKKNKRILIFSLAYEPFVGGAEIAIKEITNRIENVEFDLITLRFDRNLAKFEKINNVNVHRIGFALKNPTMADLSKFPLKLNKYFYVFLSFLKAQKLNKKYKYDGIWAMMAAYAGFGAMFFKWKNSQIPFLLTLQEGDPIGYIKHRVRFVRFFFAQIFKKADYLQAISNYLLDFGKSMGFTGDGVLIPNAVDVDHFSKDYPREELDKLKKALNKKESDKFIITTSRLVKKNAISDVIKSLKYLSDDFKFLILGQGPDKEKLISLAKQEKVFDRVKFLGLVDHKELPKYLKISDVFIRPSLSEGMGNSFIEAMASKIPVLATPVGGIVDFLFGKKTGLFVKVKNPKDIAEKIKLLLSDDKLREKIVQNAYEMVKNKYDWKLIASEMNKIFQKM